MRLSAEAMNAALADFEALEYSTQLAAAYEVFLTAKWIEAHEGGNLPSFSNVGRAVPSVFGLLPGHNLGRLAPFKYDWRTLQDTGRKTVWNNNSRAGNRLSQTLLVNQHIRNGLQPNAAQLLGTLLPTDARPSAQSLAVLVLRDHNFTDTDDWADAEALLLTELALSPADLAAITSGTPLGVPLLSTEEWTPETIEEPLRPTEAVVVQTPAVGAAAGAGRPEDQATLSVVVDSRVERMLRLAITAYSSILLVGPPGTGKGTLLKWAIAEIASKPDAYGFEPGFSPAPLWRTPDESWTSYELIGGLAPDEDGVLKWSSGALLNAIQEDRWLILDETNRGDMDKIMGPLLTWLSRQEVEIGRSEAHGGAPVRLGWSSERASDVVEDNETRYLAGRDWRLLGTYNPQDAQRVFRFGQALSRRFVIVPVPAVKPGQFAQLLDQAYEDLSADSAAAIAGLYTAHLADEATALGPAVFLGMARYLVAGSPDALVREEVETEEGTDPALRAELIGEAYVLGVGRYLAGYDDRIFDALGERIINDESVLDAGQWSWIKTQRAILS